MAKKKTPINYTSRDFESIKRDLVNHAKRSYPSVYKDFNEASFGSFMLDTVAYIGDIMSFYLDYQANESFMDTAVEFKNVTRHARQYGYKDNSSPSSTGIAEFYITVPANSTGLGPDLQYAPILKRNSEFSSNGGAPYLLIDDVNFENPNNEVIVAKVNTSTGVPISYAIRAKGRMISGKIVEENFQIGSYQRFRRTFLSIPRVAEVLSVFDSDGNEYYEVEHLSQDVIYRDVTNRKSDNDIVPALIRPFSVPRRFTLEREGISSYLQFGYGSQDEASSEADIAEPSNVVLQMNGRGYISDFNFDPSKLIETDKFGVAPVNTSLNVRYRVNKVDNVNAPVGTLVNVNKVNYSYRNIRQLNSTLVQQVNSSLEVYNPSPIVGDVSNPTSEELKLRTLNVFATQNRAVTKTDYEAMVYAMPAKFGAIKRCKITRDPDSFKRNLNLYILSEDSNGLLTMANSTLKDNLKVWLNNIKMINDTIDIIDGKIVNLAIDFKVIADTDKNKYDVLLSCVNALKRKFNQPLLLGESFYITDVYNTLNDVVGVVDTQDVRVKIKNGALYSDTRFNLNDQKSADGRYIKAPDNVSFEIKFADKDIKGTVK
jgi:hypothetical protein